LPQKPEIEPRKEKRAFAVWVSAAIVLLVVSIFVVTNVLRSAPAPGVPSSASR
jgi:uncharacterized integral membrane protein